MDQNGCPSDYEDLVKNYYGMARSIVMKYPNVHRDDVDDLTQEILVKFIAKDFLAQYDPNKTFMTPSGPRTSRFPSLFRSFVKKFLRTPVDSLSSKKAREPIRMEQPTASGEMWMEVYAPIEADNLVDEVYVSTEMERAYRHLATVKLSDDMTGDVVMQAMVEQAHEEGKVVRNRLATRLGVQDTTATRWMRKVFAELEGIGFLRDPVEA